MGGHEKRSGGDEAATLGPPAAAGGHADQGVGGRHDAPGTPPQGGGYQGICTPRKFPRLADPPGVRDPRLDDLDRMGMPAHWIKVAEAIGVDAFLTMWRVLDSEPSLWDDIPGSPMHIRLRRYESYLRYQRNRLIETLSDRGFSIEQIRRYVSLNLCEEISKRHIERLSKRG